MIARLAMLAGLLVSSGLLFEILGPGAVSCAHGGCDDVLHSQFSRPLGIPLPVFGVVYFASLLGLSLGWGETTARFYRLVSILGAVGGASLFLVQALVLHRICPYCLIVDCAAMAVAMANLIGFSTGPLPRSSKWVNASWVTIGLMVAAMGGTFWTLTRRYEPPVELVQLIDPRRVTIVEIGNPRCGHCRYMHQVINRLESDFGDSIVRYTFLLPTIGKPEGREIARTVACARKQHRERKMFDSLFLLENGDLSSSDCRILATERECVMSDFESCMMDPETEKLVDSESAWLKRATPRGIPAVWIDGQLQVGLKGLSPTDKAIRLALKERAWRQETKIH